MEFYQNPRLSLVNKGIRFCKENDVNFILAVGGGSVIDSAKKIGYGVTNDGMWGIFMILKKNQRPCFADWMYFNNCCHRFRDE